MTSKSWLARLLSLMGPSDATNEKAASSEASRQLLASLLNMAWFVEARDPYTGGHLWRVSRYSRVVAEQAGLGSKAAASIGLGGFLHDLGKIAVPDSILRKAGKLTDEEYDVIKTHPSVGSRMLAGHPLGHMVEDAVLLHHERPDGLGYPFGRSADLPNMALVVGVCDAFDAMTSHRPYRAGMPIEKAIAIIQGEAGKQFDPRFCSSLSALAKDGALVHVAGHSDVGIPLQSCPNCGPTLALTRNSQAGKLIYCRNCTGQFKLASDAGGKLFAEPTGEMGKPNDLMPELDHDLIKHTIREAVDELPSLLELEEQ